MKNIFKYTVLLLLLSSFVSANDCLSGYLAPLQTHNAAKEITFKCGAQVQNYTSSNLLPSSEVKNPSGPCLTTCATAPCTSSNNISKLDLGIFQSTNSSTRLTVNVDDTVTVGAGSDNEFREIKVNDAGVVNFSSNNSVYKIKTLNLKEEAEVYFSGGKYWIEEIIFEDNVKLNVIGNDIVELYVEKDFKVDKEVEINFSNTNSNPSKNLFIYTYGDLSLEKSNIDFIAVAYAKGKITLKESVHVEGAFAGEEVLFEDNATVDYDAAAITALDNNNICGGAGVCQSTFSNGLQTHENGKKIEFKCGGAILNPSSTILNTDEVVYDNATGSCLFTCGNIHCFQTGNVVNVIDPGSFQNTNSGVKLDINTNQTYTVGLSSDTEFQEVELKSGSTLNFSTLAPETVYKIKKLKTKENTTINLVPGDYWIKDLDVNKDNLTINVVGTGTARLFFNDNTHFKNKVLINANSGEPNPAKKLWIYSYDELKLDNPESQVVAVLYAKKDVNIEENVTLIGAALGKRITVEEGATVIYDPVGVQSLDWGTTCPTNNSAVSYFEVNHDNNGVHCFPEPVVVKAMDNGEVVTTYTGTIVLDTQIGKGSWTVQTGSGTLVDSTLNDGLAVYTYDAADNGVATFSLDYQDGPSVVNVRVYDQNDANITDDDSEGSLTFAPNGFIITATQVSGSVPPSYSETNTAGISDTMYITAYGISPSNPTCGIIEGYSGSKSLKFWMDYVNPGSGTIVSKIDNIDIGTTEGGAVSIPVTFTSGRAQVDILYRDVGSIQINVKDDTTSDVVYGSTNSFVVKPARFVISVPSNPSPTTADGLVFRAAGESFTVNVQVQDNDGNVTPNYGNENIPEGIKLVSSTLVLPLDGRNGSNNDGAIANGTSFVKLSPGNFQGTTFSYDEVGIIKLTASVADGSYLGTEDVSGPESDNVGRFIPHHFNITGNTPLFDAGCVAGSFTYIGQPILYNVDPEITVVAQSESNSITENYKDDFWKLNLDGKLTYSQNNLVLTFNSDNAVTDIQFTDNQDGTGRFVFSDGGGLFYEKLTGTNEVEFGAEIQLSVDVSDSDGVTYTSNPFTFGGTGVGEGILFNLGNSMRQGRLVANNAIGSELTNLTMNYSTEYYTVNGYELNTADSCTASITPADVLLTVDPAGLSTSVTVNPTVAGTGTIVFTPPNQYGSAEVELDLSVTGANLPWLQFDWSYDGNNDGVFDDNPRARVDFGLYEGNDEVIYFREVY